jgi:hypothetical protein
MSTFRLLELLLASKALSTAVPMTGEATMPSASPRARRVKLMMAVRMAETAQLNFEYSPSTVSSLAKMER